MQSTWVTHQCSALCAQVESRCEVRQALPMPGPGALPLPPSMEPARLKFLPDRIEDLNVLLPEGVPQLETPPAHPKARSTSTLATCPVHPLVLSMTCVCCG